MVKIHCKKWTLYKGVDADNNGYTLPKMEFFIWAFLSLKFYLQMKEIEGSLLGTICYQIYLHWHGYIA